MLDYFGPTEADLDCPDCGAKMTLRQTYKAKFGDDPGRKLFYGCSRFPECKGSHGAHDCGTPLGIPANKETKRARIAAHEAFDQLWRGRKARMTRKEAYWKLAERMGVKEIHIAECDKEGCERVIEASRALLTGKKLTGQDRES